MTANQTFAGAIPAVVLRQFSPILIKGRGTKVKTKVESVTQEMPTSNSPEFLKAEDIQRTMKKQSPFPR